MLIGRETELNYLEEKYAASDSQLILFYGRRRVGKTETLRTFFQDKPHFFYSCPCLPDAMQQKRFSERMAEECCNGSESEVFLNWESAFCGIRRLPFGDQKKLVIIDNFSNLYKENDRIPAILERVWTSWLRDANVMLILSGSTVSYEEKRFFGAGSPLFHEATGICHIQELGFSEISKFFPQYSFTDQVLTYAILGGIPYYLNQFDPQKPLSENIKEHILKKDSLLYRETAFLLPEDEHKRSICNALMEAMAPGFLEIPAIFRKISCIDVFKLSAGLQKLTDIDIAKRETARVRYPGESIDRCDDLYSLKDHFLQFWYTFCFTHLSDLEERKVEEVYKGVIEPALYDFADHAFRLVCTEFLKNEQKYGRLPFSSSKLGYWIGKTTIRDAQNPADLLEAETKIDLLAIDPEGKNYLIGVTRFGREPFCYEDYLDAKAKLTPQQKSATFYYALFSASGFEEKLLMAKQTEPALKLYDLSKIAEEQKE